MSNESLTSKQDGLRTWGDFLERELNEQLLHRKGIEIHHSHIRRLIAFLRTTDEPTSALTFQGQVTQWMHACFGEEIARDRVDRNHRFLEEALELVQANGCGASEAHQLVDYVFNRPAGELVQEVGGVMVTLAALCSASDALMDLAAKNELARVWTKIDVIRAKQAAKPKLSPLPGPSEPPSAVLRADLGNCREPGSFEKRMETFERVTRTAEPPTCTTCNGTQWDSTLCVSSGVTVEQLIDAYSDASMAAALARGTARYDDAVANMADARNALIAEIERLRQQRDELLEALELLVALPVRCRANRIEIDTGSYGEAVEIVRKSRAAIARAEGRSDG